MSETALGSIIRLQIQRGNLKEKVGDRRVYDPSLILEAKELVITRGGAFVRAADGSFIVDVHNTAHPYTKHSGANPLSVNFSGHYDAIRGRFGAHLMPGYAGENILVECARRVSIEQIQGGLRIETRSGEVRLESVIVDAPCLPFTQHTLGTAEAPPALTKESLQFLNDGMRGFYCEFRGDAPATLAVGDQMYALD